MKRISGVEIAFAPSVRRSCGPRTPRFRFETRRTASARWQVLGNPAHRRWCAAFTRGLAVLGRYAFGAALLETEAFAVHFQDVGGKGLASATEISVLPTAEPAGRWRNKGERATGREGTHPSGEEMVIRGSASLRFVDDFDR